METTTETTATEATQAPATQNGKTEGRPRCATCDGWGPRDDGLLGKPWICSWCRTRAEMDSQMEELRRLPKTQPRTAPPPNDEERKCGLRTPKPEKPEKAPKPPKQPAMAHAELPGGNKLSCLDAAAKVLETGQQMTCQEMIDAMATQGLWVSPGGKTPAATLWAAIYREGVKKGDKSRFVQHGSGGKAGFTRRAEG